MAENFGPGVTRTLDALARQFTAVIWQDGKPPLDSELNLISQMTWENLAQEVKSQVHSGFFIDPSRAKEDFSFDPLASNLFYFGRKATDETSQPVLYACVNGWVLPIAGTLMTDGILNTIKLYPPPDTDYRIDLVFLEVWRARVAPIPSLVNKPSASTLWKYGNVEFGGTNLTDDLEDYTIGFETTERVQLQYRLRVVGSGSGLGTSIALDIYPDGMEDPNVKAQGAASSPTTFAFTNMRTALGDPSLWRAGDGNSSNTLGTIDGYVYGIPICAISRRNSTPFVAVASAGTPNQNGSTNRTPSSVGLPDPRSGARILTQATLTSALGPTVLGNVNITNLSGSALGDPALFSSSAKRFLVIGTGVSQEVVAFTSANVPGGTIYLSERGRAGTLARRHPAGTPVVLYNTRPDGLYSDTIVQDDIIDLRRGVCFGDWDHQELLQAAVVSLLKGELKTSPKKSGTGGNTFGVVSTEASYFHSYTSSSIPNWVGQVDGPDGIRTIWSDSAAPQGDVAMLLDPSVPLVGGYTSTTFDVNVALQWSIGPDFQPAGFIPVGSTGQAWKNGAAIFLYLGGNGTSGRDGALAGFCQNPNPKAVRFLTPREMWKTKYLESDTGQQYPWRIRFVGGTGNSLTPVGPTRNGWLGARFTAPPVDGEVVAEHPGPLYPRVEANFEKPFIVLGTLLNSSMSFNLDMNLGGAGPFFGPDAEGLYEIETGLDFDLIGNFYRKDSAGNFTNDPSTLTSPLLQGTRTLWGMLTDNGRDVTGESSEVYVVITGDPTYQFNNGVFRVVGAGLWARYTIHSATTITRVKVKPMVQGFTGLTSNTGTTVRVQFRSQYMAQGVATSLLGGMPDAMVVFTDLMNEDGGTSNQWNPLNLALLAPNSDIFLSKIVLDTTLIWSPSRGASPRVPGNILRFSLMGADPSHVRNQMSDIDPAFCTEAGFPSLERIYDPAHVQLWNRLPSMGLDAPNAPAYGGTLVGLSEMDREHELFVDMGSKTVIFRPFKRHQMTLKGLTGTPAYSLIGPSTYLSGVIKDGAGIFTGSGSPQMGYAVPPEYMPRFGRQDIPYHVRTSTSDPILPGINHLFCDSTDPTGQVFYIIGGEDNTSPATNAVYPMLFDSASSGSLPYGSRVTITGPAQPCYMARKIFDSSVVSSDLGYGMWGVELPPYLGIARLYGVYERNDFIANVPAGYSGAHLPDRITPISPGPTNLLRKNASKQTLFIRQGGGQDVAGDSGDHTYVVPESAIDITLIPSYTGGTGYQYFNDFNYIVECEIFGFARGFINQNNFVVARKHSGAGATVLDGDDAELTQVAMVLPAPATRGDSMYEAYTRMVYQGDPYMTRDGASPQVSDCSSRYGQILSSEAYYLNYSIEQFDSTTGVMSVQRPNARGLQVLASMDFFTTLGTGKIGGQMWPGTFMDSGFLDSRTAGASGRITSSISQPPWLVLPRTFSEGQRGNSSRASLSIKLLDPNYINGTTTTLRIKFTHLDNTATTFDGGVDFTGATSVDLANSLATAINASSSFVNTCRASAVADRVVLTATPTGAQGNQILVSMYTTDDLTASTIAAAQIQSGSSLAQYPLSNDHPNLNNVFGAHFEGGVDLPMNAGQGGSEIGLTGITEKLPLGILLSDSDFLGENIARDNSSALVAFQGGVRSVYLNLPLTSRGEEYTRFLGGPGEQLSMSDGAILTYVPYNPPKGLSGTRKFRLYRGGGAGFMISGINPGGPLSWVSESFPESMHPVLKGAALACKALLVRNFHEEAFAVGVSGRTRSEGDELQLVVMTYGIFGDGLTVQDGVTLRGTISPTGYGEGYAAMDRYRIMGHPMDRGRIRTIPDPTQQPAPYPGVPTP